MNLEYELTFQVNLKPPIMMGPGPYGMRIFVEVVGGRAEGPRIKGEVLTGGGDWLLVGADGWGRVDVRAQLLTDDGAAIYAYYCGLLEMNDKVQSAISGASETDFSDQYFRTTPRFETGDPRYAWMNQNIFVGEGRVRQGPMVEYKVYRLRPPDGDQSSEAALQRRARPGGVRMGTATAWGALPVLGRGRGMETSVDALPGAEVDDDPGPRRPARAVKSWWEAIEPRELRTRGWRWPRSRPRRSRLSMNTSSSCPPLRTRTRPRACLAESRCRRRAVETTRRRP